MLQHADEPRNPMKRTMDTGQEAQDEQTIPSELKERVVRGDGTVLPERTDSQPRNPMKRMMDIAREDRRNEQ
jgi:hypothetical protein